VLASCCEEELLVLYREGVEYAMGVVSQKKKCTYGGGGALVITH